MATFPCTIENGHSIIRQDKVLFDYPNEEIFFGDDELMPDGTHIELNYGAGAPMIPVSLNGNTYPFVLDTGAVISHIAPDLTTGINVMEVREDFHPNSGRFQVNCVNTTTVVGGVRLDGTSRNATPNISELLMHTLTR